MKIATAHLESIAPYSVSRFYQTEHLPKENAQDYEKRTWKDRAHYTAAGHVFIPPMCFKRMLESTARFVGMQIPGKGKSTYTKHFLAGLLVLEGLVLPETRETLQGEWWHVPSDGKPGGGKRVLKCFPIIPHWEGGITFHILDDTITKDVFEEHLTQAGNFNGIGRSRPQVGGIYGRFKVNSVVWS